MKVTGILDGQRLALQGIPEIMKVVDLPETGPVVVKSISRSYDSDSREIKNIVVQLTKNSVIID